MDDMERSLVRAKPSVAPEDLVELEQWTTKYGEEGGLPMYVLGCIGLFTSHLKEKVRVHGQRNGGRRAKQSASHGIG
jgi:hypothetical protein